MKTANRISLFKTITLEIKCPYCDNEHFITDNEYDVYYDEATWAIIDLLDRGEDATFECPDCEKEFIINCYKEY